MKSSSIGAMKTPLSSPRFQSSLGALPTAILHRAALENVNQAVELWIETAREFGDPVPEPKGARLMLA